MTKLQYGICGNIAAATKGEDNPYTCLREEVVQQLLLDLNRRPQTKAQILAAYPDVQDYLNRMLHLGMLRQQAEQTMVNFTLFDEVDKQLVWKVSDKYAQTLASILSSKQQQLHAFLEQLATPFVDVRQLSFLVLGCYLLDWGALSMLNDWGAIDSRKRQPGGNVYTLWAEVQVPGALRAVYWGGHSMQAGDFLLHTFGDHDPATKRMAMPDILYRVHNGELPGKEDFRALQMWKNEELGQDLAKVLAAIGREGTDEKRIRDTAVLPDGSKLNTMLSLLESLGYIRRQAGRYLLLVPYLTMDDLDILEGASRIVVPVLEQWAEASLKQYEQDIASSSPLQNGVPFKEVFVQCWHYVFGLTNKQLAEQGVICDTYSAKSHWKGYLPGLIKGPVLPTLLERLKSVSVLGR